MSDTGKLRTALEQSGFNKVAWRWYGIDQCATAIFNDLSKSSGTRRLKVWLGTAVFDAPVAQQKLLERKLKQAFGDRYLTGYFIRLPKYVAHCGEGKSLCIRLKK